MTKTFTHNELIQYVYNELPAELKVPLERVLQTDQALGETCADLLAAKRLLNKLNPEPGEVSIQNILAYSRNFCCQA